MPAAGRNLPRHKHCHWRNLPPSLDSAAPLEYSGTQAWRPAIRRAPFLCFHILRMKLAFARCSVGVLDANSNVAATGPESRRLGLCRRDCAVETLICEMSADNTPPERRVDRTATRLGLLRGGLTLGMFAALMALVAYEPPLARGNTLVDFNTNFGTIEVDLFDNATPATVTNFLNYLTAGTYTDSIIHRSSPIASTNANDIIQGGGFNTNFNLITPSTPRESSTNITCRMWRARSPWRERPP